MGWLVQSLILCLILNTVDGQTVGMYEALYDGPVTSTTNVDFVINYFDTSPPVVWVVDSTLTLSNSNCNINTPLSDFTLTVDATLNPKKLLVNGVQTDCPFENSPDTQYTIKMLAKVDASQNSSGDVQFELSAPGSNRTLTQIDGTAAFTTPAPPPPVNTNTINAVDYDPTLEIINGSDNVVTLLALGAAARLRFKMTIPNYVQYVDDAGARVTNCLASDNSAFTGPRVQKFIGDNGCFVEHLQSLPVTAGFSPESNTTMGTKEFVAQTPLFDVFNVEMIPTTGNVDLFIRCEITYCDDDTITTPGTCGGPHCSAATRKKRDSDVTHTVSTHVTILGNSNGETHRDNKNMCSESCDMTDGYKGTMGAMGGLVAILFFAMLFNYKGVMNAYERRLKVTRSRTGSSYAASSSGKPTTMSEISAATILKTPASFVSSRGTHRGTYNAYM